jgi:transposase
VNHQDLLRSLDYWDDQTIGKSESATLLRLALEFGIGPQAIVWDAASTYLEGETNSLVRYGYSRDHRPDRPQVNVDLFLDAEHHLPVYSRSYEGNVVDVSRFPRAIEDLSQQYPDWRPMVITDCGTISHETLIMMRHLGAGSYERTPGRRGQANGYKPKTVATRMGKVTMGIPQVRDCDFYPSSLEKGIRS